MTSVSDNKETIRQLVKAINSRNFDSLDEIVREDVVLHNTEADGLAGFKGLFQTMVDGSDDLQFGIEDMFGEEDRVAVRWTMKGTHTGELLGYPATQNKLNGTAMWIFRLEDGQVAERWYETDWSALRSALEA